MFGRGWMRELEFRDALHRRIKEKSAIELKTDVCQRCGFCCHAHPCSLSPDELHRISKSMKMSDADFFVKYCVVADDNVITFARTSWSEYLGSTVPDDATWDTDPCVFWSRENGCAIHEVKPASASLYCCGKSKKPMEPTAWDANDIARLMRSHYRRTARKAVPR